MHRVFKYNVSESQSLLYIPSYPLVCSTVCGQADSVLCLVQVGCSLRSPCALEAT